MDVTLSIGTRLAGILGVMVALMAALAGGALWFTTRQSATLDGLSASFDSVVTHSIPLGHRIDGIRYDLVQVQQWLTDISATRGLDGMDDGLKKAAEFADRFQADTAEAERLAAALDLPQVRAALAETVRAFGPFYEHGKQMAEAYVRGGPAEGNRLMEELDATTEALDGSVERLLEGVDAIAAAHLEALRASVTDAKARSAGMVNANLLALVAVALIAGASLLYTRARLIRPLLGTATAMTDLAAGRRLDPASLADTGRRDEIGRMQEALRIFHAQAQENEQLRRTNEAEQERAAQQQRSALQRMASTVEHEAQQAVAAVSAHAADLRANAHSMAASAERVAEDAESVAAAAQQALGNAGTLSDATAALAAAVAAIGAQAARAGTATRRGIDVGETATGIVGRLSQSVAKIGEVTDLIASIAGQTNLLALNATIEAARAGDAGKGFAVVAGEVKNLASQTASSTEEIARQIAAVQAETERAVAAVRDVVAIVHEVAAVAGAVAGAVEEQGVATRDIGQVVDETTQAARVVAERIAAVHAEAADSRGRAQTVQAVADRVADGVDSLKRSVVTIVQAAVA